MSEKEDFWRELLGDELAYLLEDDKKDAPTVGGSPEPGREEHPALWAELMGEAGGKAGGETENIAGAPRDDAGAVRPAVPEAGRAAPPHTAEPPPRAGGEERGEAMSAEDFEMLQQFFGTRAARSAADTQSRSAARRGAEPHVGRRERVTQSRSAGREEQSAAKSRAPAGASALTGTKTGKSADRAEDLPEELVGSEKFDVDFDFEGEYQDVNEKPVSRGRYKKVGCLSGIMLFLFVVCVSAALAGLAWMAATDVLALGKESSAVELTVPAEIFSERVEEVKKEDGAVEQKKVRAADIDSLTDILYDSGLIRYKKLFGLFAKFAHADTKVSAGTYVLNTNYDYRALVNGMTAAGGKRAEISVTIPEGYTVAKTVELLEKNKVCDADELWEVLADYEFDYDFMEGMEKGDKYRLEGYLFPDTYTFYVGDKPVNVVKKLLSNFEKKWTEEFDEKAEKLGMTRQEILTVASLIEKEAGGDTERKDIASVIYNRLASSSFPYLQIDASIYYGVSRNGGEFSTELDDPYNTYLYRGLPPGPIANPGLASVKAALDPADTSYYFYALGKNGLHKFFRDYEGFTNFVNSDEYGG